MQIRTPETHGWERYRIGYSLSVRENSCWLPEIHYKHYRYHRSILTRQVVKRSVLRRNNTKIIKFSMFFSDGLASKSVMPMSCNPTTNKNLQGITLQRTRNFNVALLSKNTAWPTITSASWWIDNLRGYWSNLLMNLTEEMTILWLRLRPCGIMIKIVFMPEINVERTLVLIYESSHFKSRHDKKTNLRVSPEFSNWLSMTLQGVLNALIDAKPVFGIRKVRNYLSTQIRTSWTSRIELRSFASPTQKRTLLQQSTHEAVCGR
jgi:hypothetical protein